MPAYKDDKRGTWYVKYSVDGKQKLKRGFKTKREALAFEAKQKTAPVTESGMTFEDLAESYYKYRSPKESTREHQTAMLMKHVPFYGSGCDSLSKADLMKWYLALDAADLKPSGKNLVLTVVKSVFKYGEDFYDLPNPAKGLKRFKVPKSDFSVWTPEEFDRFIRCVEMVHYRNLFLFLYMTGCRKSEAVGLRYDDIDRNRCHIRGTKTDTSDRWVILPDAVMSAIQPVLAQSSEERPFVFGGEESLKLTTIQWYFSKAVKESGVTPIRIHDLRHSFASNAIAAGCNIVAVSKYLGHSNINITLSVYAHLLQQTETDMIEKLNKTYQNRITAL